MPTRLLPLAVLALAAAASPARADALGAASGYNLFVFEDASSNTDSEGRVAIGGNAMLDRFGTNTRGTGTGDTPALVVGGNLNYPEGQVFGGSAYVGGAATLGRFGIPNGTVRSGLGTNLPVDFAAARADLLGRSQTWSSLAVNGATVDNGYGTLTLTGTQGVNVFSVDGSTLSRFSNIVVSAPAGSTALVNVTGSGPVSIANGMKTEGVTKAGIVWNFGDTTDLRLGSISFQGSILAPNAALDLRNGNIEGTTIVRTLTANNGGEFHSAPFTGALGDPGPGGPPAVPAPAGVVLGMIGAVALGIVRWRG